MAVDEKSAFPYVAQEWLGDGITKGTVHNEYGSRVLKLEPPSTLAIGMDVVERRTRNREKLKKQADSRPRFSPC